MPEKLTMLPQWERVMFPERVREINRFAKKCLPPSELRLFEAGNSVLYQFSHGRLQDYVVSLVADSELGEFCKRPEELLQAYAIENLSEELFRNKFGHVTPKFSFVGCTSSGKSFVEPPVIITTGRALKKAGIIKGTELKAV